MATAKIATLAIRTLAKPIATQLKSQAAQHETFRKICIALAQRMHRTEMALRTNLLPNGTSQKVRPLNDAKAIANGANAISEGFLFFVAAALILGETYRGSRKKAEQRDRTEDSVKQVTEQVEKLANLLGLSLEQLDEAASRQSRPEDEANTATEESDPSLIEARLHVLRQKQDEELHNRQLQAAVQVLLRLALKNQWVAGQDALELEQILNPSSYSSQVSSQSLPAESKTSSSQADPSDTTSPSSSLQTASTSSTTTTTPSATNSKSSDPQLSIIQQVALERAKAIAKEARGDPQSTMSDPSLAELLEQYQQRAPS